MQTLVCNTAPPLPLPCIFTGGYLRYLSALSHPAPCHWTTSFPAIFNTSTCSLHRLSIPQKIWLVVSSLGWLPVILKPKKAVTVFYSEMQQNFLLMLTHEESPTLFNVIHLQKPSSNKSFKSICHYCIWVLLQAYSACKPLLSCVNSKTGFAGISHRTVKLYQSPLGPRAPYVIHRNEKEIPCRGQRLQEGSLEVITGV